MSKTVGAPSQHSQPSRKGKRAWRKNVDIGEIEAGIDSLRDEERLTGAQLHQKANQDLFQIDVKGDEQLKRTLPKYDRSQLISSKILAQRSALPAVFSRASQKPHTLVSREEKGRLLRMGKRKVKGPFNSFLDPSQLGAGSAMLEPTEAVKRSGTYNVWEDTSAAARDRVKGKGKYTDPEEFLLPLVSRPSIKAPDTVHPHSGIELPAVAPPHQGTSYNPLETAHRELLLTAHERELRLEADAAKFEGVKQRMAAARQTVAAGIESGASGMVIDSEDTAVEGENGTEVPQDRVVPKVPVRKTQKQRRKAAQILAEERPILSFVANLIRPLKILQRRALLDHRRHKRFLAAMSSAKSLRAQVAVSVRRRLAALEARRAARAELVKHRGLIGQRLGKHRIQEGQVDVQLGEELTESLRELKPQGNLFRDRFLSLQHRALVEPRVPVLPKRRRTRIKEYEKHAWKRFE
ncbi:ribosome biogenesis protein Nop53/GLTSCR2 [Gautieria morchelliformis]|nr:ribosome biogenesis protein Nop53/GLTSCR2 [Gautieria morchelliformis]